MDIASKTAVIEEKVCTSKWQDYEHVSGYVVMILPFSSGHLLGLRVWPESDFAPYISVWHRPPGGRWSIYSDGPSLDTTCPRWWGPVLENAELTAIDVNWTAPNELQVEMKKPQLEWSMTMSAPLLLQVLNVISAKLPFWTWKPTWLLNVREWIAEQYLGLGKLNFSFTAPSGHSSVIMPEEVYYISESNARWEGVDLGDPVILEITPFIGNTPLPVRSTFGIGHAYARIRDYDEYRRTRERYSENFMD